jgi:YHS domain-containing protein
MHFDVVCGRPVSPAEAPGQTEHEGRQYWFCSVDCLQDFADDPEAYVAGSRTRAGRVRAAR